MSFLQKYYTFKELFHEHQDTLDDLFLNEVPSTYFLNKRQELLDHSQKNIYYLKLKEQSNIPSAFFQFSLEEQNMKPLLGRKEVFMNRLFNYPNVLKTLRAQSYGQKGMGVLAKNNDDILNIERQMQEIIKEESIQEKVHFSTYDIHDIDWKDEKIIEDGLGSRLLPIKKEFHSYENYLNSLSEKVVHDVKNLWQRIYDNKRVHIRKYSHANEISQHLNFFIWNQIIGINNYLTLTQEFPFILFSIEIESSPIGVILFWESEDGKKLFCEIHLGHHKRDHFLYEYSLQHAIMFFYKLKNYEELLFINQKFVPSDVNYFESINLPSENFRHITISFHKKINKLIAPYRMSFI